MKSMTAAIWLMLLILGLLWGGSFVFVGIALRALGPITIAGFRVGLSALLLNGVMLATGRRYPSSLRRTGEFLVMGFLNNALPFVLIIWGQTRIPAGTASILNAATPLSAILLAHFLTGDERLTSNRIIGVLIGLAGVVVLVGPEALGGAAGNPWPRLSVLGAGISYSLAGIFGKRFGRNGVDPIVVSAGQLTGSSVVLLPVMAWLEKPWRQPAPGTEVVLAVLGLAVLSTALAYILYFRILGASGAGNTLLVTMIVPFFAVFLGTCMLGEIPGARDMAALFVLVAGLAVVDGRLFRKRKAVDG